MGKELGIVLLYIVGMGLVVAEILLPGVILGLIGIICILGSIYFGFVTKPALGWTMAGLTLISIPFLIALWSKVLNRLMAMKHTEEGYSGAQVELKALLGKEGVALTMLRPAGAARIADRKVDVISEGEIIDVDTRVTVVEVKGNRVVVRPVKG